MRSLVNQWSISVLGSFEAPRSNSFRFILRQSNFVSRSERLAALAVRHPVPTVFETREFVAAGGLVGYGGNLSDAFHLAGVYAARILKGEKPGELPVQQSTKVEMFLNLKTAKSFGLTMPTALLVRADEVIE